MGGGQPDSIAFGGVFTKIIKGRPPYFRALFMMLIEVVEGRVTFVISVISVIFVISLLVPIVLDLSFHQMINP